MTTQDNPKRAAARKLLSRGIATQSEIAELADVSRQLVRYWADGIDPTREFADEWPTDPSDLNISERDMRAARLAEFRG